jgi:hypothetical protein
MTAELFEDAIPDTQIREFTCYQLLCAGCGTGWSDELDYVPWFKSRHDLLMDAESEYFFGWVAGKLYCHPCRNDLVCAAAGQHQPDEGFVYSDCGVQYWLRNCTICGHITRDVTP